MKNCITMLMCVIVIGFCQNLLSNSSFETWTADMPDFWYKDDSILLYQENVVIHSGIFSVKESLVTQVQNQADFMSDTVNVLPNSQYTFSIWVHDNDLAARLRQMVSWHTTAGWTNTYSNNYSGNSTNWQELTLTAVSPNGSDLAIVFIRAYDSAATWDSGAVFYLDDASLFMVGGPPVIAWVWHQPVNPGPGITETIYAKVSDEGTIISDTLYYGINNLNTPVKLTHTIISNDTFRFQIPGQSADDTVFYYLKFTDNDDLTTFSDTYSYYIGQVGIYINEVYYDTPGPDSGCFIELYGPPGKNLNGISLTGINGSNGAIYTTIDLNGNLVPNDGFFVIAQNSSVVNVDTVTASANLQNGPDNLALRFNNIVIDALGYGTLDGWVFTGEWRPAKDVAEGHCLNRYPDGNDTDNNSVDFYDYGTTTPGEPNPAVRIFEHNYFFRSLTAVRNPVISGINYGSIITEKDYYPISVYNILGQLIQRISLPETKLELPGGIYFLKLNSADRQMLKTVVVK